MSVFSVRGDTRLLSDEKRIKVIIDDVSEKKKHVLFLTIK